MPCTDYRHIQLRIESAREELRRQAHENAPGRDELGPSAWERAARVSLFSAEIDAQFHKARCAQCRNRDDFAQAEFAEAA
jgi:hypothetical protein